MRKKTIKIRKIGKIRKIRKIRKKMILWIRTKKEKKARRKQQKKEEKSKRRRERRENIKNNLPNIVLLGVLLAIIVIVLMTMVAIIAMSCFEVKDFVKKAEATLLGSGLSIVGLAIAVWTGLNIVNAIEKREVEEIKRSIEETKVQIENMEEDIERVKGKRHDIFFVTFMQELLKTNYDVMSRYFYKKFSEEPFQMVDDYINLITIEQYFNQVYSQYGEKDSIKSLISKKADEGIELVEKIVLLREKERNGLISNENEVLDMYLLFRQYEFHFLKGYLLSGIHKYDAFLFAAEGFIRIRSSFGVEIPDYTESIEVNSISYNGVAENLNVAVYFLNTIGESYSKISEENSLIGMYDKADVKITEGDMITYSNKAIFYLELTMKWNEKLEEREVYYRNLGCAYERADRISNKFGEHASEIIKNYKKAFINVISNKEVKMSRVQNVYHTLLSYYERYMKFTFFIGVISKNLHENIELFEEFLKGENIGIDISVKKYLIEYQRTSEIAITDNARFSLQRALSGLSWTWIVVLLLKNDEFIATEYPNTLTSYLEKIKEKIDIIGIMGITDDYSKELKKRYDVICEYLQKH